MTCGSAKIRRLPLGHSEWVWYWEEADGKWKQYRKYAELETRYLSGKKTTNVTAGSKQYELNFADMLLKNMRTKVARRVRRRPMFQNASEQYSSIPIYWDPKLLPTVGYERIMLETSSPEYSTVFSLFNRTMAGWNILSIERIQNLHLWKFFKLQKDNMKTKAGKDVDERLLFHGTNCQYVDAICRDNIDWRMCGKNGTRYGKGSYFARDAKYSNSYTDKLGPKSIFVCRVLVGDFTTGERTFKKPPLKDEQYRFNSCVDNIDQPGIFVIFEKSQIYPEYLIQYQNPNEEMYLDVPQIPPKPQTNVTPLPLTQSNALMTEEMLPENLNPIRRVDD
ncbi:protein mono-ADP-ribosyltransferase PARP12-like [Engraulis encrasicolus]|uniref:protein mono-ADP-ribosyltransferase PARP12-like n=1 Tax=Engraulis encrasicolus TaxID=184585 RepID=UPI002FCEA8AD